jgi:hypothetical protein
LVGKVKTVDKWPLLVSNNTKNCDPLNGKSVNLADDKGNGVNVKGELYEVENLSERDGFDLKTLDVKLDSGDLKTANVYMSSDVSEIYVDGVPLSGV